MAAPIRFETLNMRPMMGKPSSNVAIKPNATVSHDSGTLTSIGPLAFLDPAPDFVLCHVFLGKVGFVEVLRCLQSTEAGKVQWNDEGQGR